jgi:hypothetical protein
MADGDADLLEQPGAMSPGSSLLIAGPAMTGKRRLMFDLLEDAADTRAAFVTTKRDAKGMEAEVGAVWTLADWELSFVDCVSRQRGVQFAPETGTVEYVATPGDLTGIGIALSGFMQDAYHDPDAAHPAVGLHSLSTLLMYADVRRVYQFLHVITGRIDSSGFSGVFTFDLVGGEEEHLARIRELFDGLIEVREEADEGRQLRTRGAVDGPRRWVPYPLK